MAVRVLGCSGSIAAGNRTTAFLVGEQVLIDAGTGVGDLELDELQRIDHILLTHSHLDHIAAVPLMADSVMRRRRDAGRGAIQVHALPATLQALRQHVFNDVIWPDFTRIPSAQDPALRFVPFETGDTLHIADCHVEVMPAAHTVPGVGFAVWHDRAGDAPCWVFSGDTGPCPPFWRRLAEMNVGQLVIETAFSDDEREVAQRSGHWSPARLSEDLRRLAGHPEIFITHIKPGEHQAVLQAFARQGLPHRVTALERGQRMG